MSSPTGEYAERGEYHRHLSPDWEFYPTYLAKMDAVRRYLTALPAKTRVLDAGCGEGVLVEEFHERLAIEGIDPNFQSAHVQRASLTSLPFSDGSFGRALCLDVLEHLSFDEQPRALAELARVLDPGGALWFVEHGLAPDAGTRRWQRVLNPMWRRVTGGCHLDRDMPGILRDAGFELDELTAGYSGTLRWLSFTFQGCARPAGR